eukprot:TRINITY_DN15280_c1_g3_i1.p1 TRINITY_DN15280_c1_g3~~TRINITY_DN15280_c1_g3_i1.p1  ORF type:complete len:959 (-),score=142.59 TRINITY_DN15280_c1_g3_i1:174-3050(-)
MSGPNFDWLWDESPAVTVPSTRLTSRNRELLESVWSNGAETYTPKKSLSRKINEKWTIQRPPDRGARNRSPSPDSPNPPWRNSMPTSPIFDECLKEVMASNTTPATPSTVAATPTALPASPHLLAAAPPSVLATPQTALASPQTECKAPLQSPIQSPSSPSPTKPNSPDRPKGSRPKTSARIFRKPSRVTLAEASRSSYGLHTWRGTDLQNYMEKTKEEAHELAKYRRECHLEQQNKDRARVVRRHLIALGEAVNSSSDESSSCSDSEEFEAWDDNPEAKAMAEMALSKFAEGRQTICSSPLGGARNQRASHALQNLMEKRRGKIITIVDQQTSSGAAGNSRKIGHADSTNNRQKITRGATFDGATPKRGGADRARRRFSNYPGGVARKRFSQVVVAQRFNAEQKRGSLVGLKMERTCTTEESERMKERRKRIQAMTKCHQIEQLKAARYEDFEHLPEKEKAKLKVAFNSADHEGKGALDLKGLGRALAALGHVPGELAEKQAVRRVLTEASVAGNVNFMDFVFQVVPKVDQELGKARSPGLFAAFNAAEKGFGKGTDASVPVDAAFEALRRFTDANSGNIVDDLYAKFWRFFSKDCAKLLEAQQHPDKTVDFAGFRSVHLTLMAEYANFKDQAERRAAKQGHLSHAAEADHFGELSFTRSVFERYDPGQANVLSQNKLLLALFDVGVIPIVGKAATAVIAEFGAMSPYSIFNFEQFLNYISHYRKVEFQSRTGTVASIYTSKRWELHQSVAVDQVPLIIFEYGFCSDCCSRLGEVVAICEEYKGKFESKLTQDELCSFVGQVVETARVLARRREGTVAKTAKLNDDQVLRLRCLFGMMTSSGVLGVPDITHMLNNIDDEAQPIEHHQVATLMRQALTAGSGNTDSYELKVAEQVKTEEEEVPVSPGGRRKSKKGKDFYVTEEEQIVLRFDGFLRLIGLLISGKCVISTLFRAMHQPE